MKSRDDTAGRSRRIFGPRQNGDWSTGQTFRHAAGAARTAIETPETSGLWDLLHRTSEVGQ